MNQNNFLVFSTLILMNCEFGLSECAISVLVKIHRETPRKICFRTDDSPVQTVTVHLLKVSLPSYLRFDNYNFFFNFVPITDVTVHYCDLYKAAGDSNEHKAHQIRHITRTNYFRCQIFRYSWRWMCRYCQLGSNHTLCRRQARKAERTILYLH